MRKPLATSDLRLGNGKGRDNGIGNGNSGYWEPATKGIIMKSEIHSFRDLKAWQKSLDLSQRLYCITQSFPKHEMFGLVQQIRRASVSVPANIAEGWGRGSTPDYVRFLRTSRGSLCEIETEVHLAQRLGYLPPLEMDRLLKDVEECSRILQGLIASLERKMIVGVGILGLAVSGVVTALLASFC